MSFIFRAADALFELMQGQGAGHLVHMPAHTYIRVGRYSDAIEASLQSITLDKQYLEQCLEPYGADHNKALLVAATMLSGRLSLALEHANPSAIKMPEDAAKFVWRRFPRPQDLVLARFGRWEDLLELQARDVLQESTPPSLLAVH